MCTPRTGEFVYVKGLYLTLYFDAVNVSQHSFFHRQKDFGNLNLPHCICEGYIYGVKGVKYGISKMREVWLSYVHPVICAQCTRSIFLPHPYCSLLAHVILIVTFVLRACVNFMPNGICPYYALMLRDMPPGTINSLRCMHDVRAHAVHPCHSVRHMGAWHLYRGCAPVFVHRALCLLSIGGALLSGGWRYRVL